MNEIFCLRSRALTTLTLLVLLAVVAGCAGRVTVPPAAPPPSQTAAAAANSVKASFEDDRAVHALAQAVDERLGLMRDVAAAKHASGAPVQDVAREQAVLDHAAQRARALGLDAEATRRFFDAQIRLARAVQERWLAQWRAAGRCDVCADALSLQALRDRIDAVNEQQLAALYLLAPLRTDANETLVAELVPRLSQRGLDAAAAPELAALAGAVRRGPTAGALERIRATRVLRIATTGDYAPFSLERDGQLSGADIELARELAAHLGAEPRFVRTSWPGLLADLRDGRFDVALSGIAWTPERAASGDYSSPYQSGGKTLLARCSERERFDTPDELDRDGVRVIVNPGGTNERYVREHVRQARVIVHPDNRGVFAEIAAGRADVMVTDDVEAELQARRWPGQLCRTYAGTLTQGDKRILMSRDPALQAAVEAWLQAQMAAREPARLLEQAMDDYVRAAAGH